MTPEIKPAEEAIQKPRDLINALLSSSLRKPVKMRPADIMHGYADEDEDEDEADYDYDEDEEDNW